MDLIKQTFPIAEQLIAKGLQLSQQLLSELQQEENLLKHPTNAESLDAITQRKQPLIQELNVFYKQIGQVLETESLTNSRTGIESYFEKAERANFQTAKAANDWKRLLESAEQCRLLNERNGAAIELLLRHTRQSLNIIKGKPQSGHTYGPDGTTKADLFSETRFSV
ncbi:MAG: flagellar protein FlgN [Methylomicrobium sp.]